MDKERFHNQLALRLGYDRIVNNKGIVIKVEYDNPNDPRILIELPEGVTEGFYASEVPTVVYSRLRQPNDVKKEIVTIIDAVHQAYLESNKNFLMI